MAITRKLTAIAFFDVVNYTGMMNKDESATLQLLEKFRKILYPSVQSCNGTVLKELGDGALVCFDSVLSAIQCGVNVQREVRKIQSLRLRIGIHVGDVVLEEKDVFGEGVNIAARIQPLAVAGGIVITEDVWRQCRNQTGFSVLSLGSRNLKGVTLPVKVFAIDAEGIVVPGFRERILRRPTVKRAAIISTIFAIIISSYFAASLLLGLDTGYVPSIAILQLKNIGLQDDDAYTYGITEDLIIDVAKAGLVRVSPMKDILSIQKSDIPLKALAEQLHVRYIMDGSLKRDGNTFRLSAHIIDVPTGLTLWADRIQTNVKEASSLQGKLATAIIEALKLRPSAIVKNDITKEKTVSPESYEFYLRGKYLLEKKKNKEDIILARGMFERALNIDTSFVGARLGLGETYVLQGEFPTAQNILETALNISRINQAKLDEAKSLVKLGIVRRNVADYQTAQNYYNEALNIFQLLEDRNGQAAVLNNLGNVYLYIGDYAKTVESYLQSLKIRQELGDRSGEATTLNNLGVGFQVQGQYTQAIESYNQSLKITRELGDIRNEALALNNLGYFAEILSDYSKALDYYRKSAKISQTLGDRRTECITLKNIGNIYQTKDEFANALDYYYQSRTLAQTLNDRSTEAEIIGNLGRLFFEQHEVRRAIDSLKVSIARYLDIGEEQNLIWMTSWLAFAEATAGDFSSAATHLASIEKAMTSAQQSEYFIEILWNLSRSYLLINKPSDADRTLKQAYDEVQTTAGKIKDDGIRKVFLTKNEMNAAIIAAWNKAHPVQ